VNRTVDNFIRVILTVLATARLTRFVTQDFLGHWWIVQPARRWAVFGTPLYHTLPESIDAEWEENEPRTWRQKLVKGLDCPFCVGFWIGGLVLLTGVICTALGPIPRAVWRFTMGTFALNYVVGHLSSRVDG
jgi:hypothetical protein